MCGKVQEKEQTSNTVTVENMSCNVFYDNIFSLTSLSRKENSTSHHFILERLHLVEQPPSVKSGLKSAPRPSQSVIFIFISA